MKLLLAFTFILALAGPELAEAASLSGRYEHKLVSDADCERIRKENPIFHCTAMLQFTSDGRVMIRFTDIMNASRYRIDGDQVSFHVSEFGRTYRLRISSGGRYLVDGNGRTFTKTR